MNNTLPTESEILALHKKYAPSEEVFEAAYTHCRAVWRIAESLIAAQGLTLEQELVKAGCLLHDIGTYRLMQPTDPINVGYVGRGVEGEQILKEEGLPEALGKIVAHHVGHGFTKELIERTFTPLPHRDLTPKTKEERLVNYVSKLHTRADPQQFNSVNTYRSFIRKLDDKYYLEDFESLVKEFGEPDLGPLAEEFGHKLV